MIKDIVKYSVIAILLVIAWFFRRTIKAISKKIVRVVKEADTKLSEKVGK